MRSLGFTGVVGVDAAEGHSVFTFRTHITCVIRRVHVAMMRQNQDRSAAGGAFNRSHEDH